MGLNSGTRLGPYEIQSPLGAGGMGEVYRARDTRLDRTVAIKILPSHLSENPEAKQRFEREARTISSLNHPNICTLHDVGRQDGVDYLVMEYLEGETLADRLRKGPLPMAQVLKYGIEICEALEKAHRSGVTHRDLKPGNIMLTKTGAKLMDFGLAKALVAHADATSGLTVTMTTPMGSHPLTAQGTVMGTFQYMAPEQVEGKEADARSDIFALGAVLYEMATAKRAFEGKTAASAMAAVLERDPAPISSVQPMSPTALDHVVQGCLAKDPEARWQSASGHWAASCAGLRAEGPAWRAAPPIQARRSVARTRNLGCGSCASAGGARVVTAARTRARTNVAVVSASAGANEFRLHRGLLGAAGDQRRGNGGGVLRAVAEGAQRDLGANPGRTDGPEVGGDRGRFVSVLVGGRKMARLFWRRAPKEGPGGGRSGDGAGGGLESTRRSVEPGQRYFVRGGLPRHAFFDRRGRRYTGAGHEVREQQADDAPVAAVSSRRETFFIFRGEPFGRYGAGRVLRIAGGRKLPACSGL